MIPLPAQSAPVYLREDPFGPGAAQLLPLALEQALQLAAGEALQVPLVRRPQEQALKLSEQLWRSFLQRRSSIYSPNFTCAIMRRPVLGVNN